MTMPLSATLERLATAIKDPLTVVRWPGGESNRLYRLTTADGVFALRLNHPEPDRLGVDRDTERRVLKAVSGQPWAPRLCEAGDAWILTEWALGEPPARGERTDLDTLLRLIGEVQATAVQARTLNVTRQIALLEAYAPPWPEAIKSALHRRCAQYRFPTDTVLCHHDWHPGNLRVHDDHWTILDWEFAALGDPAVDLASVALGFALTERQRARLCEAFDLSAERFTEACCLMDALGVIWYQANPGLSQAPLPSAEDWHRRWF